MEHTELPWKVVANAFAQKILVRPSGSVLNIALCNEEFRFEQMTLEKCEANAEYIVKCCNALPTIKERLEKAVCPYCAGPCGKRNPDQHHCTWCDETRAALAAGGE